MSAPTTGPTMYTQRFAKWRAMIAGPMERAGFIEAPEMGLHTSKEEGRGAKGVPRTHQKKLPIVVGGVGWGKREFNIIECPDVRRQ